MNNKEIKKYLIAAGAVSLALLTATPALADSDRKSDQDGNRFGLKLQLLGNKDNWKNHNKKDWKENRDKNKEEINAQFSINGTVTAISGSTLTVRADNGTVYSVNAANAKFDDHAKLDVTLSDVRVNDTIKVRGTLSGTTITATKVHDKSAVQREFVERFGGITVGTVTAIGGGTFVIDPAGDKATATVTTTGATTFKANGKTATSGDVQVGSTVLIVGTTTTSSADNSLISASAVHIWTKSMNWLKHLLVR